MSNSVVQPRRVPAPKAVLNMLAAAGIFGPILFTVGFVGQGLFRGDLRAGYSWIAQEISELTAGPLGWVQQVNFVLFGLLLIAFAMGLHWGVRRAGTGVVGPALVAWNGVTLVIAGLFPLREDAAGRIYDPLGVHSVNGTLFFLTIGVGLIVLSRRFARDERWRNLAAYTLATGVAMFVLFFVDGLLAQGHQAPLHPWLGLLQRAILAVWFPCLIVLALRLRQRARAGGRGIGEEA